jgi:hypothetical protein
MTSEPDLTVKQVVTDTKEIAAEVPKAITVTKSDIYLFEKLIVQAFPGTPLSKEVSSISNGVTTGLVQADEAAAGLTKLIGQFGIPLAIAGGVKLQGTGAIVSAATNAEGKLMEGVRYALTNRQRIITEVSGWLTLVVTIGSAVLALNPAFGTTALGGGVTVGLLIQGIKNVIIPRLNEYSDAK